jgi:DNA-directed RNA polymerase subunit F
MKINSSSPLTLASVKDMLKAREKEGELGYEQKQAQEYSEKFARQDRKKAEELVGKVMENKKIGREAAVMIVNIAPANPETVKTIAQKDKAELTDEEAQEIAKLFK